MAARTMAAAQRPRPIHLCWDGACGEWFFCGDIKEVKKGSQLCIFEKLFFQKKGNFGSCIFCSPSTTHSLDRLPIEKLKEDSLNARV
jgi:hypothetical protein